MLAASHQILRPLDGLFVEAVEDVEEEVRVAAVVDIPQYENRKSRVAFMNRLAPLRTTVHESPGTSSASAPGLVD